MHIKAAAEVYRDTAAMIDKIIARYDRLITSDYQEAKSRAHCSRRATSD